MSPARSARMHVNIHQGGFRTDVSVETWLNSLGLGHLTEAFVKADYNDCLMIQVSLVTSTSLRRLYFHHVIRKCLLRPGPYAFP